VTGSTDSPFTAIVVAAGSSNRFGGTIPKQYQDLCGHSVLERSVRALADRPSVRGVVVVLAAEDAAGVQGARVREWPGVSAVVPGGEIRSASVWRGIEAAGDAQFVLIHDAARPMASPALVDAVIEATLRHGGAIPVLPVHDTVKRVSGELIEGTLERGSLRLAQTPQGFRTERLREAMDRARSEGAELTDEAAAMERCGHPVAAVPGDPQNVKITTPQDLAGARRTLEGLKMELRVGSGFDVHRFGGTDRRLVLGGVAFPGEPGLLGHSDADVVLHAVMDALLGAAALGDIGHHFPPEDPGFKDACSAELTREVARLIEAEGYSVVNLDITLLAETPKIRGRAEEMRASIAGCLGIEISRVGLKATTLEGLGALGRGEGAACQATALLNCPEAS
jgi:2-C-methyl-D-erythritol 4-phosphate cytidylyltransferase/2-C-methyl-D-erythritol 2,4-cyclodiphosphate synthase